VKRENPLLISATLLVCTNLLMPSITATANHPARDEADTLSAVERVPARASPAHRGHIPVVPIEVPELRSCTVECPPGGIEEQEPCGDDTNGGCNMADPTFEPLACNTTVCGTGWFDGSTRDADWYEVVLTEFSILTISLEAEFDALFGPMEQYLFGLPVATTSPGIWSRRACRASASR